MAPMYEYQITNNGKRVWEAIYVYRTPENVRMRIRGQGSTKNEAVARREKNIQKRMLTGMNKPIPANSPTVEKYLLTWLESPTNQKLGDETFRKYKRDIELHVIPHIGKEKLKSLDNEILEKLFYQTLDNTGSSAKKHAFKTFNTMLNHAVRRNVLTVNPLNNVEVPVHDTVVAKDDERLNSKRIKITKYLLNWIAEPTNPYYDHYPRLLFMLIGLRRSELLGIQWSSVENLDRKGKASVNISTQISRYEAHTGKKGWYVKDITKGKKPRRIPLPEMWRKALLTEKNKKRVANEDWASDLVFLRENGNHLTYNYNLEMWNEILSAYMNKTNDVPKVLTDDDRFRPHAVRHLAASILFDAGVPLEIAQEILGHSEKSMTMHYTHLSKEALRTGINSIEDKLTFT